MLEIDVDMKELDRLLAMFADTPKKIPREANIVINKTAKKHIKDIGKKVRTEIAINAKGALEGLRLRKKSTAGNLGAIVSVDPTARPSLKRFKARQTKSGVSYTLKKGGGRSKIAGAFGPNIPRLGEHAFKRAGPNRYPIIKLKGVSPWGVYTKNKWQPWSKKTVEADMLQQIEKRIKFELFKQSKEALRP